MLATLACLAIVIALVLVAEVLWRKKLLKGENQRKFVHISVGTFAAFWPWLISWRAIQLIGIAMTIGVIANRLSPHLHYLGGIRIKHNYGDIFLPLAIVLTSLITTNKIFFALAILHVSLADGLAAVIGTNFGKYWRYRIFEHTKTVLGTMTFWLVSVSILGLGILGMGVLPAQDIFAYSNFFWLLLLLPPAVTMIENVVGLGMDNIAVPAAVLIGLNMAI